MSTPDPEPYPWLPFDVVRDHLRILDPSPELERMRAAIERARRFAGEFVQDNRPDRWVWSEVDGVLTRTEFFAGPRLVEAALLVAARFHARAGSALGQVAYGEFATQMLRFDPDVSLALGIGRNAKPKVG
jgi:hypothetical protein